MREIRPTAILTWDRQIYTGRQEYKIRRSANYIHDSPHLERSGDEEGCGCVHRDVVVCWDGEDDVPDAVRAEHLAESNILRRHVQLVSFCLAPLCREIPAQRAHKHMIRTDARRSSHKNLTAVEPTRCPWYNIAHAHPGTPVHRHKTRCSTTCLAYPAFTKTRPGAVTLTSAADRMAWSTATSVLSTRLWALVQICRTPSIPASSAP